MTKSERSLEEIAKGDESKGSGEQQSIDKEALQKKIDELDKIAAERKISGKIGFDTVFDCAGVATSLATAVQHVRPRGTVVGLALQYEALLPTSLMMMKEVRLEFSLAYTSLEFEAVITAINEGQLKPQAMITKRIALKDVVQEGLEVLKSKGNTECKILIDLSL